MIDVTVIATAAITGAVGLTAAAMQTRSGRLVLQSEDRRRRNDSIDGRRRERQQAYERALDLLVLWEWDRDSSSAPRKYDVVESFSKPFVVAVTRIRMYGSPASVAAVDQIQESLALLNRANSLGSEELAWDAITAGIDALYKAARDDTGPSPDDQLPDVSFRRSGGPLA